MLENIQVYNKAIAGFVVTLVVGLAAQYGLNLSTDVQQSIGILITALITGISVWWIRNKKAK